MHPGKKRATQGCELVIVLFCATRPLYAALAAHNCLVNNNQDLACPARTEPAETMITKGFARSLHARW